MRKISYTQLQKKYPKKMVVLNLAEDKILAVGKNADELLKQLIKKKINLEECVFEGPSLRFRIEKRKLRRDWYLSLG